MRLLKKNKIKKPTKVLCKRTMTIGDDHWWDDKVSPPVRHEIDNRMVVEGDWYDVIEDGDKTPVSKKDNWFKIIDNQGKPHAFSMYTKEDKKNFPSHCDLYGPRDYEKWFYTPEELEQLDAGTYNPTYKEEKAICVLLGNLHWVLMGGSWVPAKAVKKHEEFGKHYWNVIGSEELLTDDDFLAVGERLDSHRDQLNKEIKTKAQSELIDILAELVDAINKPEEEEVYASVEYHMPFVNEAWKKYSNKIWSTLKDSPFFEGK